MKFRGLILGVILISSLCFIDGGAIGESSKSVREESQASPDTHIEEPPKAAPAQEAAEAVHGKPELTQADGSVTAVPNIDSNHDNCTDTNGTACQTDNNPSTLTKLKDMYNEHKGMLMRSFYVLIGVTGIVIIYFIVRTVR